MTCHPENVRPDSSPTIRDFNDKLRRELPHGQVMITRAVSELPIQNIQQILKLVREFNTFTADNDPWGEHDFGKVSFDGAQYFWKIDAYDLNMEYGSPDPTDETVTKRVITVMTEFDL